MRFKRLSVLAATGSALALLLAFASPDATAQGKQRNLCSKSECLSDCSNIDCLDFCGVSRCQPPSRCKAFGKAVAACKQACRRCSSR